MLGSCFADLPDGESPQAFRLLPGSRRTDDTILLHPFGQSTNEGRHAQPAKNLAECASTQPSASCRLGALNPSGAGSRRFGQRTFRSRWSSLGTSLASVAKRRLPPDKAMRPACAAPPVHPPCIATRHQQRILWPCSPCRPWLSPRTLRTRPDQSPTSSARDDWY